MGGMGGMGGAGGMDFAKMMAQMGGSSAYYYCRLIDYHMLPRLNLHLNSNSYLSVCNKPVLLILPNVTLYHNQPKIVPLIIHFHTHKHLPSQHYLLHNLFVTKCSRLFTFFLPLF